MQETAQDRDILEAIRDTFGKGEFTVDDAMFLRHKQGSLVRRVEHRLDRLANLGRLTRRVKNNEWIYRVSS